MEETVKVVVDAMGGDNAPGEIIKGAVNAVLQRKDIQILLVGQEAVIQKELAGYTYPREQIAVVDAPEVIETAAYCGAMQSMRLFHG